MATTTTTTTTTTTDEMEGGSDALQILNTQIAEYTSQLADIEELLKATPRDESLLALHKDLVELLGLTKHSLVTEMSVSSSLSSSIGVADGSGGDVGDKLPVPPPPAPSTEAAGTAEGSMWNEYTATGAEAPATIITTTVDGDKKKTKKLKEFVVPAHLIVNNETDSEADKKKKRRALKALKNQHREKRKEFEHEKKQNAWQSFQQKKKKSSGFDSNATGGGSGSIFATKESVNDRVGVVSKMTKTDFGARQRHKPL